MTTVYGSQTPQTDDDGGYNSLTFVIKQALKQIQTLTLVEVISCTNTDAVAGSGFVNVQPLVNQMTGNRLAVPHGPLFQLPYARLGAGSNAVIIDPQPGDIGIAGFAARDISAVVASRAQANPGSFRMFDWADGLYLGAVLTAAPAQYIAFMAGLLFGASVTRTTGNLAVGTGASGVLTDTSGQTATFQDGILVNLA